MALELVADKSAAHDADGLAGLALVGGLRADDEHLAEAALPLGDVADLHRAGEDIARTDVVEVLVVGTAVEDALEAGLEAERFGSARGRLARDHDWVAEEAGRSDDRAIASGLGGRFVEENGIGVTDSACELTATGVVNLACDGLGFLADDGSHFVGARRLADRSEDLSVRVRVVRRALPQISRWSCGRGGRWGEVHRRRWFRWWPRRKGRESKGGGRESEGGGRRRQLPASRQWWLAARRAVVPGRGAGWSSAGCARTRSRRRCRRRSVE